MQDKGKFYIGGFIIAIAIIVDNPAAKSVKTNF